MYSVDFRTVRPYKDYKYTLEKRKRTLLFWCANWGVPGSVSMDLSKYFKNRQELSPFQQEDELGWQLDEEQDRFECLPLECNSREMIDT